MRRVFELDRALITTVSGMLRSPGALVAGYLEGRRSGLLDPLHYFISSIFVQLVIAGATRAIAPLIERESALSWLQHVGGVVTVKVLFVFWMAGVWRLLFGGSLQPRRDLRIRDVRLCDDRPALGCRADRRSHRAGVARHESHSGLIRHDTHRVRLLELAVWQFSRLPWWNAALRRRRDVLAVGYGVMVALIGLERAVMLLLPPMPA